ncbi:carbon-nitrogen hydrolase [Bombardia bombarda]|uniref:Carbon-nitrogen hydrolase n=1 Tax=Bombardia bombarda TaxID=252184 RepID=A0AA39XKT6_9PEZI|nr:carbon-nitrogen hydrolase [Bombardia bombarda]
MRIGCLQFAPKVGDVSNNLNRADAVLAKADPTELDNLDLLVLPEMAFSGYNFKSVQHITPYLEPSGSGISSLWARTTALKYDCTVAVGYPEKVTASRRRPSVSSSPEYYNSLIIVNGDGETVANYRKSFLYYTDATWALEGGGFYAGEMEDFGQVAMGICMDINPYRFEAPWNAFEFSVHVLRVKANLVILSMAWLTREDRSTFTPFPQDPDMETITYWIQRMEPIIRAEKDEETIVIFCNRCGIEDDVVYAGTSAVVGIKNGEVSVYGLLGRGVKELLVVNTDLPPFAKLVNRPEIATGAEGDVSSSQPEQQSEKESPLTSVHDAASTPAGSPISSHVSPGQVDTAQPEPESMVQTMYTDASAAEEDGQSDSNQVETRSHMREDSPSLSPMHPLSHEEPDDCSECDESDCYSGCDGDCGGCDEHAFVGSLEALQTPTCPSPTPMAARPKLEISTGPETLPPLRTRKIPRGMDPGNFFTSRDLCTPPATPFDDHSMPATYYRRSPPSAIPTSANIHTPDEPVWPGFEGSSKIDPRRAPARGPPSRSDNRTTQPKTPVPKLIDDGVAEEVVVLPRPMSPKFRNASRSPTLTHHSSRSDPAQYLKRAKSFGDSRLLNQEEPTGACSPCKEAKSDRGRRLEELKPTKTLWDSQFKDMIPIAASPSVFQTTFPPIAAPIYNITHTSRDESVVEEQPEPPRPKSRLGHRAGSKSASNSIPMFQYEAPPIPQTPLISSYSPRATSRGRQPAKQQGMPSPTKGGHYGSVRHTPKSSMGGLVHPDIQAMLMTEDEASAGRTVLRGEKSRERGQWTPSRRHSIVEEEIDAILSSLDARSPISN